MLRPWIVVTGLLVLAVNLRAALAGYPPLLETVRIELGTSTGVAGAVQAGAVLMMAAGSFAGAALGERFGTERALGMAVGLVALGSAARSVAELPALIGGSAVVGFGIGTAGVLLTAVVKERLPDRVGTVTGAYVVSMLVGATAASAVAVPLAVVLGGWSWSLAVWAVPAALAAAGWLAMARRDERRMPGELRSVSDAHSDKLRSVSDAHSDKLRSVSDAHSDKLRSVSDAHSDKLRSVSDAHSDKLRSASRTGPPWQDRLTRASALYLAGASLMVYGWMTWLAPLYEDRGWSPQAAGLLLAAWSIAQIPAALLVPALAERTGRWALWSGATLACGVAGTLGVLLAPEPPLVGPWLWVVLIGVGAGAGFPLGLTMIAWRTPDGATSASVSGLALGVGYTVAGLGPLLMGVLIDLSGGFPAAVAVLLAAGAAQAAAIIVLDRLPPVTRPEATAGPARGRSAARSTGTARDR